MLHSVCGGCGGAGWSYVWMWGWGVRSGHMCVCGGGGLAYVGVGEVQGGYGCVYVWETGRCGVVICEIGGGAGCKVVICVYVVERGAGRSCVCVRVCVCGGDGEVRGGHMCMWGGVGVCAGWSHLECMGITTLYIAIECTIYSINDPELVMSITTVCQYNYVCLFFLEVEFFCR